MSDVEGWSGYYAHTTGRDVRPLFARALEVRRTVDDGSTAIDVGCGDGTETRALLAAGFSVTAVDADPDAVRRLADLVDDPRLTVVQAAMQDFSWPSVDLLHAGLSLPFCPPASFGAVWASVVGALRPGAVLAVDLFGDRDTWATEDTRPHKQMTFVTRARLDDLLNGLVDVEIEEEDADGMAYSGPKHWHRFQVVARMPGQTR